MSGGGASSCPLLEPLKPGKLLGRISVSADLFKESLLERTALAKFLQRRLFDKFAFGNDPHMRTQALDDIENVRGQEHGGTACHVTRQHVANDSRRHGVHAFER